MTRTTRTGALTADALGDAVWKKSSHSGDGNGQCVEVADLTATPRGCLAVRDSKNPGGPALLFAPSALACFVSEVRDGGFAG